MNLIHGSFCRVVACVLLSILFSITSHAQRKAAAQDGDVQFVPVSIRTTADSLVGVAVADDEDITVALEDFANSEYCSSVCVKKSYVKIEVKVDDNGYYRNGTTAFTLTMDLKLGGYTGGSLQWPGSQIVVPISLVVDPTNVIPSQTYICDITKQHPEYCGTEADEFEDFVVTLDNIDDLGMSPTQRGLLTVVVTLVEEYAIDPPDFTSCPTGRYVKPTSVTTTNPLKLEWAYMDGVTPCDDKFPMAEVQVLRLFNEDAANRTSASRIKTTIDWSKAQKFYVYGYAQLLSFTLAEGTGYYTWRVRPIGNANEGGAGNILNWGCWSDAPEDGDVVNATASTYAANVSSLNTAFGANSVFYYKQFDFDKNWYFSRSFKEDRDGGAGIDEGMEFSSPSGRTVQEQSLVQSTHDVLLAQTIADYQGVGALKTLPVPATRTGSPAAPAVLGYKSDVSTSGGTDYRAEHFDGAATYLPDAMGGLHAGYYGVSPNVPSAGERPYARSVVSNDPLKRPKEIGSIGDLGVGTGHSVRMQYGGVTDVELVTMFGAEAPSDSSVTKVITTDPNGVVHVKYERYDGKVIATCLLETDPNPNLLELNDKSNINDITLSDTLRNGSLDSVRKIVATMDIVLADTTPVTFKYFLDPQDFSLECQEFCRSCDYDVHLEVFSETGSLVYEHSGSIDSATCVSSGTETETSDPETLLPGTYTMRRTLTPRALSTSRLTKYREDARNAHRAVVEDIMADIFNSVSGPDDLDSLRNREHLVKPGVARRLLHAYKAFRADVADGGTTAVLEVNDCCSIDLPLTTCETGCEPGVTYDYEALLKTRWSSTVDANSVLPHNKISTYFTYCDTSEYLYDIDTGGYTDGEGVINDMIEAMIAAGGYDCGEVYDCWVATVELYWQSAWEKVGSVWLRRPGYNLLDQFLDCVGTKYCSVTPYTNKIGTGGWVLNAWRVLPQSPNTAERDSCEAMYLGTPDYITDCLVDADAANETYRQLRACYAGKRLMKFDAYRNRSLDSIEKYNPDFNPEEVETCDKACIENMLEKWSDTCKTRCEQRRQAFKDSLVVLYQRANHAVRGQRNNPVSPTDTLELFELNCMVNVLVEACLNDCDLTVTWDTKGTPTPADDTLLTPTREQRQKHYIARTSNTFRLAIPVGEECPSEIWQHLDGEVPLAELVEGVLNDELKIYRDTIGVTLSRWNLEPIFRNLAAHFPELNVCFPPPPDSINPMDTLGVQVHPYSNMTLMVDLSQDTKFYIHRSEGVCDLRYDMPEVTSLSEEYDPVNPHPLVGMLNRHLREAFIKRINTDFVADDYTTGIMTNTSTLNPTKYWTTWAIWPDVVYQTAWPFDQLKPAFACDADGFDVYEPWELCPVKITCINGEEVSLDEIPPDVMSIRTHTRELVQRTPTEDSIRYVVSTIQLQLCGHSIFTDFAVNLYDSTLSILMQVDAVTYEWKKKIVGDSTDIDNLIAMGAFTSWVGKFIQLDNGNLAYQVLMNGENDIIELPCLNFKCDMPYTAPCSFISICNMCDTVQCGNICFRWVANDTLQAFTTIKPLTCAQSEVERLVSAIESQLYGSCLQNKLEEIDISYNSTCFDPGRVKDHFVAEWDETMYHYTLYYYDRSGNLVKTIPPKGFIPYPSTATRATATGAHKMPTTYAYNTLNQIVRSKNPDGGETKFWYDPVGRLRLTQNAQQNVDGVYSFMDYDQLGRVIRSGQSTIANPVTHAATVPSTTCDDYLMKMTHTGSYSMPNPWSGRTQRYLRNRVSRALSDNDGDTTTADDRVATYYSYDVHGNVEWLIQDMPGPGTPSRIVTLTEYTYDLISNKVKEVRYQPGRYDQFFHRYEYDHDQRIVKVETSRDGYIWERDAAYEYYTHGPLLREEMGRDRVQGLDYVYTANGWLKAINHPAIDEALDAGHDGTSVHVGRDVFGMMLGYYAFDYKHSDTSTKFIDTTRWSLRGRNLFDGNIGARMWDSRKADGTKQGALGSVYTYDLLGRLRADSVRIANSTPPIWPAIAYTDWFTRLEYDGNGNITQLERTTGTSLIDQLVYHYPSMSGATPDNRLQYIEDLQSDDNVVTYDVDDQISTNYGYDANGSLVKDLSMDIDAGDVAWNHANQIVSVVKDGISKVEYLYDANGNRVRKKYYEPENTLVNTTWYSRDAKGTVMAVYEKSGTSALTVIERGMHGMKRIGSYTKPRTYTIDTVATEDTLYSRELRHKSYEITDQLGNIRATVSDIVLPLYSFYRPDVLTLSDYYPLGLQIDERKYAATDMHRYGYNGQEKDLGINGDGNHYTAQFWEYDSRVGLRWNTDPRPDPSFSRYAVFANNPILHADPLGDTVQGVNGTSGTRIQQTMRNTFAGPSGAALRRLFTLNADRKTMAPIASGDFARAVANLSQDAQRLAYGYYNAINSTDMHQVEMVRRNENLSTTGVTALNTAQNPVATGADVDRIWGGGVNNHTGRRSYTAIVMNSTVNIPDFTDGTTSSSRLSSPGELLAHEMVGHGAGGTSGSRTSGHEDALQMTNLYLRVQGVSNVYRDGRSHGTGVQLSNATATAVPAQAQIPQWMQDLITPPPPPPPLQIRPRIFPMQTFNPQDNLRNPPMRIR